jgi:hypothetical protein
MKSSNRKPGSGEQTRFPGFEEFRPVGSDSDAVPKPAGDTPVASREIPPTDEEWVDLYCAAAVLKKVAPWQWMCDSEVFGVKDPETGVIGYCTVMGRLGEHLALGVCLGEAGLAGLNGLRKKKRVDFIEFMCTQTMLKVSFEDRADLEREDLKVIKRFEFVYRGKQAWPLFRSYRPGYMPWFLTGSEARFLNLAIRQTLVVTQRLQDKPDLLAAPQPGMYLVRVSEPGDKELAWHDEWLNATPLADEDAVAGLMAEVPAEPKLIARINSRARLQSGTWEVDIRPTPAPIAPPGERPYIPLQILIADHDSGFIYDTDIREQTGYVAAFREHFVRVLDKLDQVPERILVSNQRTETVLQPVTETLAIPVEHVLKLVEIEQFYRSFEKYLHGGGRRGRA